MYSGFEMAVFHCVLNRNMFSFALNLSADYEKYCSLKLSQHGVVFIISESLLFNDNKSIVGFHCNST